MTQRYGFDVDAFSYFDVPQEFAPEQSYPFRPFNNPPGSSLFAAMEPRINSSPRKALAISTILGC